MRDRAGYFGKKFLPKNVPKIEFFEIVEKFGHYFFLDLFYKERSYYLPCYCANTLFGKYLFPEIWAKMLLANQIAPFLNQPEIIHEIACFLLADTNSRTLRLLKSVWVGMGKKWA